jgi:hypothetical protein
MNVAVHVDTSRWDRFAEKAPKRVVNAVARAGNLTLQRVRDGVQAHVRSRVKIRAGKDRFWFGSGANSPGGVAGRIEKGFSLSAGRMYGEVAISPPSGASAKRVILAGLEAGGTKDPGQGRKHVAIPLTGRPARPSFPGAVPPAFTFQGLKFKAFVVGRKRALSRSTRKGRVNETVFGEFGRVSQGQLSRGDVQWKGLQRTFILKSTRGAPEGGVFQRFGPDRGDIREIYSFEKKAPLPDTLDWERTGEEIARTWFPEEIERQLTEQILHAHT